MGIGPKDVHIHLRPLEPTCLLPETQHLFRLQIRGQIDAVAIPCQATTTTLIQHVRIKIQKSGEPIAQIRP